MRATMFLLLIGLALRGGDAHAQACPSSAGTVRAALRRAEQAYVELELDTMNRELLAAYAALGCLSEPLPPGDAASLHVIKACSSVGDDPEQALAALRGALAANPGLRLSEDLAPPGSEFWRMAARARELGPGATQPVVARGDGLLMVDGRYADVLPTERAAVVQVLAPDGAVRWSGYHDRGATLPPGAPLSVPGGANVFLSPAIEPEAPTALSPPAPALNEPVPTRRSRAPALWMAAGGAALGAGALYGWSALSARSFLDAEGADDEQRLTRLYRNNHIADVGAGLLGAAALGLGVGAAVEMRW